MIETFHDTLTKSLYLGEDPRGKVSKDLILRTRRKLDMLNEARSINDLKVPLGNRLHQLEGDRKGQWSVSVNDQWRICFEFSEGNAYRVEFCDYH